SPPAKACRWWPSPGSTTCLRSRTKPRHCPQSASACSPTARATAARTADGPTGGGRTPMKTRTCVAGVVLAVLPLAAAAQKASDRKLYCWQENGVQVCGDTIPATALDHARTEINARSGARTGQVDRAL